MFAIGARISAATGLPHSEHVPLAVVEVITGIQSEKLAISGTVQDTEWIVYFNINYCIHIYRCMDFT